MTPAVVDTGVVSFLFKSDARAQQYLPFLHDRRSGPMTRGTLAPELTAKQARDPEELVEYR